MKEYRWGPFFWRNGIPKPDGCGYFRWSITIGEFSIAWARRYRGYLIIRTPWTHRGHFGVFYPFGMGQ